MGKKITFSPVTENNIFISQNVSIFVIFKGEKGVSHVLFPLLQALMIMQVIFICSLEHIFHNTEADTEKSVYSSPPML